MDKPNFTEQSPCTLSGKSTELLQAQNYQLLKTPNELLNNSQPVSQRTLQGKAQNYFCTKLHIKIFLSNTMSTGAEILIVKPLLCVHCWAVNTCTNVIHRELHLANSKGHISKWKLLQSSHPKRQWLKNRTEMQYLTLQLIIYRINVAYCDAAEKAICQSSVTSQRDYAGLPATEKEAYD